MMPPFEHLRVRHGHCHGNDRESGVNTVKKLRRTIMEKENKKMALVAKKERLENLQAALVMHGLTDQAERLNDPIADVYEELRKFEEKGE